jgi:hypothetical protein
MLVIVVSDPFSSTLLNSIKQVLIDLDPSLVRPKLLPCALEGVQ